MKNRPRPCLLIILDGWGLNPQSQGNAVAQARTPFLDALKAKYPTTGLACSGEPVGLPDGVMGNSEVGHLNIGAGRTVFQDLLRINMAMRNGALAVNAPLNTAMDKALAGNGALHLMGLLSDGGVHSHIDHLFALLDMAKQKGITRTYVHAILDGRDTPPTSGITYLNRLLDHMTQKGYGEIASVCGRFYAMDRDNRWDRVEKAFRLYCHGEGQVATDPVSAADASYRLGETDEFVQPTAIADGDGRPLGAITDGDAIIFFNFRADRAREITRALTDPEFTSFPREPRPVLSDYVCMTQYDSQFRLPVAFPPTHPEHILGEIVSRAGLRQLRIAETEKYAHVTYFFNGGIETPFPREDRCLVPSPRDVETYDLKPEMSAREVTDELLARLCNTAYDLVVLNFANMDMVGHTGILDAAIRACETVDECVGRIIPWVLDQGGAAVITADHGNAECMITPSGEPQTAHTVNAVPLILVDDRHQSAQLATGALADIAPTLLAIMGIEQPDEMTGKSLITPH